MKSFHVLSILCVLMMCISGARGDESTEGGPVLHYDFNEGSGLIAKDKTGNNLDGQIIGAKYIRRDSGHALVLNGNSCVLVPESKRLNELGKPGQSYTIEFWFKSRGDANQSLTEKWPNSIMNYPWAIRGPGPDGAINFAVYEAKTGRSSQASYTHPATKDNKWHHLAAVRDMKSGYLLLYIDGQLGRKANDSLTKVDLSNTGAICLGARHNKPYIAYGIKGQLDDVRIYDRALTQGEVKRHCGLTELPVHRDIESADIVEKYQPVNAKVTLQAGEMTVKVGPKGAVQIDAGSDSYIVESCYSYPGSNNKIGWNGLPRRFDQPRYPVVAFQNGADPRWKPIVKKVSDDTISVEAKGKHYKLSRTIKVFDGRVDFEDKLTSLSKTPTGIVVRHGITANEDFLERYNGGLEVPANSTVFLKGTKRSAAMVMTDNFSRRRIRAALGASQNHSGVQLLRFAIDAGKTYTFAWSIYVMDKDKGSYFDFVNRLRNDWNANFAIDGPFSFAYVMPEGDDLKFFLESGSKSFYVNKVLKDPTELQEYLEWRGTKLLAFAPWLYHDPGGIDHSVTREEYIDLMKRFVPVMHKAVPHVKIIACIETDWVSFRRENIKDSDRIPIADRSKRGGPSLVVSLDPDVSQLIVDSRPSWKDSFVFDKKGGLKIYTYYRGGKAIEQPPVCVFPEVGNARYAHWMDHIKLCLEELNMDGVYFDEFPLGQNGSRRTYGGEWDGLSADVDYHTGKMYGPYKDCSLAGAQARVNAMNYVHGLGKVVIANRHSTTLAEQSIPAFRFTETGSTLAPMAIKWEVGTKPDAINYCFWTHLNSPLGLGAHGGPGKNKAQWLMTVTIYYLRQGMIFYELGIPEPVMTEKNKDVYGIVKHMFPITPAELGEGFIVGKERILTAISMDRLWSKDSKPVVHLFDMEGHEIDSADRCTITPEGKQWRIVLNLHDWAEVAVIE